MEDLQQQYDSVVASKDQLQEAFDRLDPKTNTTGRKSESLLLGIDGQIITHIVGSNTSREHKKEGKSESL